MHIALKKLDAAGLTVAVSKTHLVITGTQDLEMTTVSAVDTIAEDLHYNEGERDDLLDHVVSVQIWSLLKQLAV